MNGLQGTSADAGDVSGNPGDAGGSQLSGRSLALHCVKKAGYYLATAAQETGDGDLTRALEKIDQWIAREDGASGEGQRRR